MLKSTAFAARSVVLESLAGALCYIYDPGCQRSDDMVTGKCQPFRDWSLIVGRGGATKW